MKARQAFLLHTPGQFPGRLFPLARGNPSVFSTGCVTWPGFQQAHKEEFPKYCDKTRKQTDSQAKRRSWASRLLYNEPQILFHIDISTGWSTLICCSLHPRDSVSPDEDAHYYVLPLTLCSEFGFGSVPWDANRNSLYAVTELQLCLDTEQPLSLARYFFPHTKQLYNR